MLNLLERQPCLARGWVGVVGNHALVCRNSVGRLWRGGVASAEGWVVFMGATDL